METKISEFNILLLGETGSGKSTTVNAITTFMKYGSFDDAVASTIQHPIPCSFNITNPSDRKSVFISSGYPNSNQNRKIVGQSDTQFATGYVFKFNNCLIRLIDTPGMGDTSGIKADTENFDKILSYLQLHTKLHGVMIFLKATNNKQSVGLEYCITQLFTYLHSSVTKNVVFIYTFSSSTFFEPSDSFEMMNKLLSNELKHLGLKQIAGKNAFFFDHDVFRYLLAKQNFGACSFNETQKSVFSASWTSTVAEVQKLFSCITSFDAHNLEHTSSLNYAKKLLYELADPIVRTQVHIEKTIQDIRTETKLLEKTNQKITELARRRKFIIYDLVTVELDYPTTVCTSPKCVKVLSSDKDPVVHYINRCHEPCFLKSVVSNKIGHPDLKFCAAMDQTKSSICKKCGCPWSEHKHIWARYDEVPRECIDCSTQSKLNDEETDNQNRVTYLNKLQTVLESNQRELDTIKKVSAKLGLIVKQNATLPFNVFIEPYIKQLKKEEAIKISAFPEYSLATMERLMEMKKAHKKEVQLLMDSMESLDGDTKENVCFKQIENYRKQLINLEYNGHLFKNICDGMATNQRKVVTNDDKLVADFAGAQSSSSIVNFFNRIG